MIVDSFFHVLNFFIDQLTLISVTTQISEMLGRFLSLNKMKTYSVTIETSVPWDMGTSTSSKMR